MVMVKQTYKENHNIVTIHTHTDDLIAFNTNLFGIMLISLNAGVGEVTNQLWQQTYI